MPVGFRSASTVGADTSASLACPAPPGAAAGDLLLAVVTTSQTTGGLLTGLTASGWSAAGFWNNGGDSQIPASAVLWKAAGASEPGSYTFGRQGNTSTTDQLVIHIHAWTGVDLGDPFAAAPVKVDQTAAAPRNPVPAPSVTVPAGLAEPAMLVTAHIAMWWVGSAGTNRWTPPAGMAEISDFGAAWAQMSNHCTEVAAGATGIRTSQASTAPNQQTRGIAWALRPASTASAPLNRQFHVLA